MLGAFFLWDGSRLEPVLTGKGPSGLVPSVDVKGLTPVNIARLGDLLGVASYDAVIAQCGRKHRESDTRQSGVWQIPAAVGGALRGSRNLEPLAERWAATEELRRDGWTASHGLDVLSRLAELLTHQERRQELWYWWSV